jgi:hypothetical protein
MKKNIFLILVCFFLYSCKEERDCCVFPESAEITFKFNHNWNGTPLSNDDFNELKFTNENGETLSIIRLRYLISNITLTKNATAAIDGRSSSFKEYNLVDVTNNKNLSFTLSEPVVKDNYSNISFTFGFKDDENIDGEYQDLNVANFNVPAMMMLGGGYHYMQFDGTYLDNGNQEVPFNYHAIRAADRTQTNPWENLPDTSFTVDLGNITIEENVTININVNLAEWFKSPNTWDLNELNTVLMPNFEAQKLMNQNGKSVFSLMTVIE